MSNILRYIKKLNWSGSEFVLLLCMLGAAANKNMNSFIEWLVLVAIIGIPFSLLFLFLGKKD